MAILTAAALAGSLAGCSKNKSPVQPGNMPSSESFTEPSFDTEAPAVSDNSQVVGKVTSIEGSKITIEFGELKQKTPERNGDNDGSRRARPSEGDSDGSRRARPGDGDGNGRKRERSGDSERKKRPSGMFGYTFTATSGSGTYDLSSLKEITLENDSDDTPDTVEEIKTGDVVVITLKDDNTPSSLTVKDLNGRAGNRRPSKRSSDDGN